jgi:hypothetical protein
MAKPIAHRRAAVYRQRAQELSDTAREERREDVRRHLLDQAATFQRAADGDGAGIGVNGAWRAIARRERANKLGSALSKLKKRRKLQHGPAITA